MINKLFKRKEKKDITEKKIDKSIKTNVYIRVDKEDFENPEFNYYSQQKILIDYLIDNNYSEYGIFNDIGGNIDKLSRKACYEAGIESLLFEVHNSEYTIIVCGLSRLYERNDFSKNYFEAIKERGVNIISIEEEDIKKMYSSNSKKEKVDNE
jgi:DNA invertase Pin-like site-specific DNA recombinase